MPRRLLAPGHARVGSAVVPGVRVALPREQSATTVDVVADQLDLHRAPRRVQSVVEVAAPAVHALARVGELGRPEDRSPIVTEVAEPTGLMYLDRRERAGRRRRGY